MAQASGGGAMKNLSVVAFIALAFLIFIIYKDPMAASEIMKTFLSAVGDFFAAVWQKSGDFLGNLTS
jgi:hypothetical protein